MGNSADQFCHTRSVAYSAELILSRDDTAYSDRSCMMSLDFANCSRIEILQPLAF